LKEEAQLEYQKQLDSHLQLGKETAEALKEASAKAGLLLYLLAHSEMVFFANHVRSFILL
jgi:hypothetical protein